MSEVVGKGEFCPKVCCGGEVDVNIIAKKIQEAIEREIASSKGFFEEDEKQVEKQSIYVITYECGEQIKQEKIVVESIGELLELIEEATYVGFYTLNRKILYIKTGNIVEIREYDEKQDLVKLTPEVKIKLPNEKDEYRLSKEEMAFIFAGLEMQRCK